MIRTDNLKLVAAQRKLNPASLARLLDCSDVYAGKLLSGKSTFGEKAARSIEDKLKLPRGWLDEVHDEVDYTDESLKEIEQRSPSTKPHVEIPQKEGEPFHALTTTALLASEKSNFYKGFTSVTTLVRSPVVEWDRLGIDLYKGIDDFNEATTEFRPYFTKKQTGDRCKFVRLETDAHAPRLLHGDIILLDPDNLKPKHDEVALFSLHDGSYALMRYRSTIDGFEAYDERGRVLDSKKHGLKVCATAILFQRDQL